MQTVSQFLLAAALSLVPVRPAPTPGTAAPKGPSFSAADRSQAQKVLAAAVEKRSGGKGRPTAPKGGKTGFQAHRCAVLYDENLTGKERAANGPFRATCSGWVSRATRELAVKDGEQPCSVKEYGPGLVGCTTWVDQWEAGRGKWSEVWRKSTP